MTDLLPVPTPTADRRLVWLAVGLFAAISLLLNALSRGFLEADGITHYLYARWAFAQPHLFTDVWGRPVATVLHALPAQLPGTLLGQPVSLVAVRAVSMLLAVGCALVAWRVARGQGLAWPGVAALFMVCGPLTILHSLSELTELPFALLAVLGLWAYQHKRWWAMALLIGLTPAARPEGFGLIVMAAPILLLHRRFEVLLLALPLVVWDRLGWLQYGGAPGPWWAVFQWLKAGWPYNAQSTYAAGPLLKFAGMMPAVVGPMLLPFVLIGTAALPGPGRWRDHEARIAWALALVPWSVLIVHSLLHWAGKMASSGDVRYLVAVAPFWALLAARGFEWTATRLAWRSPLLWATLFAVVPPVVIQVYYPVVPLALDNPGKDAVGVAAWYEQSELSRTHPNLITDHPIVRYRLALNPSGHTGGKATVERASRGSIYLWHEIYSGRNADAQYVVPPEMPGEHGWRDVTPAGFAQDWRVFVTEAE